MLPRSALHTYQIAAVDFFHDGTDRQLVAVMGAGKTAVALHALADMKRAGNLSRPVLVVAPLMIASSVWHREAAKWADTADLRVIQVLGTARQRLRALQISEVDIFLVNFDNVRWLATYIAEHDLCFSVLIVDEASALKNASAQRTQICIELGKRAQHRWALTGTPRSYQLTDVWGPGMFCTEGKVFPPFYRWRGVNFFPIDPYERHWRPLPGVEDSIIDALRGFTYVVDQTALDTRPPVIEIEHAVPMPPEAEVVYEQFDNGTTDNLQALLASGIQPAHDLAVVGKLMQVLSGAVYTGEADRDWKLLHDTRLEALAEIHEGHARPTLVFVTFRHEVERILQRFPAARELRADRIDAWNRGEIELLVAHPASAGHGVNLQYGSDTIVWFSLPWSAELFQQANARIARQGQRHTVNIHILVSLDKIDRLALAVVRRRIAEQNAMIEQLRQSA
jgi:hypothetical protein